MVDDSAQQIGIDPEPIDPHYASVPQCSLDELEQGYSKPGGHRFYVPSEAHFDIQLVGGGGGGAGSVARNDDAPSGGGGEAAPFVSIIPNVLLYPGHYLIEIGKGGAGGPGGWNWRERETKCNGNAGEPTRLIRCKSGAVLYAVDGGPGGLGGAGPNKSNGLPGQNYVDVDHHVILGHGGAGGTGGKLGQDGSDATGHGAGSGGQGSTDTQNDGVSHGGQGANGFVRLSKIS